MGTSGCPVVTVRKTTLTPKAVIYQKFGNKACYKVEEVKESIQNGCPGLAIPQKGPSLYCCSLELPELFVVSGTFRKKKDAEQCAAEMALKKLGINPAADNPTEKEPWDALIERMTYLFSDEFLQSLHPLSGHLRAVLRRDAELCGFIPASVVAVCDAKLSNACKLLNPEVESNPFLALSFVMSAATRLAGSVVSTNGQLSIQKQRPYSPEIIEALDIIKSENSDIIRVEAVHIPSSLDKIVQPVSLAISPAGYYLDAIAQRLGVTDANKVLLSRNIGKASSETRVYFAATESSVIDLSANLVNLECQFEGTLNPRASYFCSQVIYGDAIMASIGYTWRSKDLFHEDVSLQSYYRMLISKMPSGNYKLSREAILAAELPSIFTTKSNWRGSFPREILCSFCRQHRLSEPVFSCVSVPLKESCLSRSQEVNVAKPVEQKQAYANGIDPATDDTESLESGSMFRCEVKIFSKCQDLIIECSPKDIYKKQNDSVHNASLKILSWLNEYFKDPGVPVEKLNYSVDVFGIRFYPENFFKEFSLCSSVYNLQHRGKQRGALPEAGSVNMPYTSPGQDVFSFKIEGKDSGICPSNGSLLCISYFVSLAIEGEDMKELLESNDEFDFEMGTGAVISPLETVLAQMSAGQSAFFKMELPPHEFIVAAADDSGKIISSLSSKACCLEYSATLLSVTEPPEERMEQALFSPPLSKQRVEYALQHIKNSCATTLVDFGCGSGSLLDSLLDYSTSLESIVGVDISQKSLSRAAKILHSKLSSMKSDSGIKSAVLYDGSIIDFDSRLCGFDIGTCLEDLDEDIFKIEVPVKHDWRRPQIISLGDICLEYMAIEGRNLQSSRWAVCSEAGACCKIADTLISGKGIMLIGLHMRLHATGIMQGLLGYICSSSFAFLVIEHMEEDQACLFGNFALSYFRPKILIVSTPNYEYNVILQRSSLTNQEEDLDEKTESQTCKFRNHDHKFEWTREQFNSWATALARQHNYSVEFSGVGGSADVEPGFASQIAVFTRRILPQEDDLSKNEQSAKNCKVLWEWNSNSDSPFC